MPGVRAPAAVMDINALAVQYAEKPDERLREELIAACAPLVRSVVADFQIHGKASEDLLQAGYLGVLAAVEGFDAARGVKFETYAKALVRGELGHYLRDTHYTIRRPRWLRRLEREMEDIVAEVLAVEGRFPRFQEIAAALNVTEDGLREILRAREVVRTTSWGAEEEVGTAEIDPRRIRHRRYVSFQLPIEDRIVLYHALDTLTVLQRKVIYYLFYWDLTQTQAAKRIGVSQKQVSRTLAAALARLRSFFTQE